MKELAAVLLIHSAKLPITAERVSAVIKATGAECDCERVKLVVEAVKDKSLEELINEGIFYTNVLISLCFFY